MKDWKRVRRRVLWQDGKYRMLRNLIIYGGGDGSWEAPFYTTPTLYWSVQVQEASWVEWKMWDTLWDARWLRGYSDYEYLYANSAARAAITRRNAQAGRDWLERHLRLKAADPWVIRCDSVDGEGSPCPVAKDGKCWVSDWFHHGYAGQFPGRDCPGECDVPLRQYSLPGGRDVHGCNLEYYRKLLEEKRLRE